MPIRPNKGGGNSGGSGSNNSPYNPAASGNTEYSDLIEVINTAGTYGVVSLSALLSGIFTLQQEDNYDGQVLITSSTSANSGGTIRLGGGGNIFPKSGDSFRVWIKMPSSIDSASVVYCGFLDATTTSPQNMTGAKISGATYNACSIVAGSTTLSSNSVTLTASSRYCIEVKYTSNTTATVKLYDSSNGNVLDTSNVTITSTRRVSIVTAFNTGTVAKDLVVVDAIEYKLTPRNVRFPV